jgi:phosphoglucosamine mutase
MKYFGTDGIRGKAYDFITEDMALAVGKSLYHFKDRSAKLIIARDTRESGEMIVKNITKGAKLAGLDVCDIGIYATPILAYSSIKNDCFGIMVTASHNPYVDNGIKVFYQGKKLKDEDEEMIEAVIERGIDFNVLSLGRDIKIPGLIEEYFSLFKSFNQTLALHIALDLANGATITSAKAMLPQFVKSVIFHGDNPNGFNINKNCGSTHLESLKKIVIDNNLDLGIAFDGDGDRILIIDDQGEIIDGDFLIYLFAKYLKEQGKLSNNVVVLSKMSNLGIIKALESLDIVVIQTEVGDKFIFRALYEEDGTLGGENSGHIINRAILESGDGVLNAWYLLKLLNHYQLPLSKFKNEVKYYPDKLVNLKDIDKTIAKNQEIIDLVNYYRDILGNNGKVLVRASGTEPLIRVSVSAETIDIVEDIIDKLVNKILSIKRGE